MSLSSTTSTDSADSCARSESTRLSSSGERRDVRWRGTRGGVAEKEVAVAQAANEVVQAAMAAEASGVGGTEEEEDGSERATEMLVCGECRE